MAFGTRYNVEIIYKAEYGKGAEICRLIQEISGKHGFLDLAKVKEKDPKQAGITYPEQKQYWVHMSKAHLGIDWRQSLVGINYLPLANKIDLVVSTVGNFADVVWASIVKSLKDRDDVLKITVKEIEQWGPGESVKEGPLFVK